MDELKSLSYSDMQRFANYLGSHLRTIAKLYHTGEFVSPEEKKQNNNWRQELVGLHHFLII